MRDWTGRRLLCAPVEEKVPQVDIPGPKSRCWGGVPHRRLGLTAWMHLANGEDICPAVCGPDTEQ